MKVTDLGCLNLEWMKVKTADISHQHIECQLIHMILFREVLPKNSNELWFDFFKKIMKLDMGEFAVVSGEVGLFDTYFEPLGRLSRDTIKMRFVSQLWNSDEDAVKLAMLYLLATYLMGNGPNVLFSRSYLAILYSKEVGILIRPRMLRWKAENTLDMECVGGSKEIKVDECKMDYVTMMEKMFAKQEQM
ncbi:hypothetical protein STAS_24654, partial [Striga asiatica]